MTPLAASVLAVALGLSPSTRPVKTDPGAAQAEREAFLTVLADGIGAAAEEYTCTGFWSGSEDCRRLWPGAPEELAALELTLGWWESKLDPEIQAGRCPVWGPAPTQITCDGRLVGAVRPRWMRGIAQQTRWGLVVHESVTVFQLKPRTQHRYDEVTGTEPVPVYEASREAARILSGFRRNCRTHDWLTCVITSYAGSITFRQAPARVATFWRVHARIKKELDQAREPHLDS